MTSHWNSPPAPCTSNLYIGASALFAALAFFGCGHDSDFVTVPGAGSSAPANDDVSAGTQAGGSTGTATGTPVVFAHPGTLNNQAELDFVKAQLAAGNEPWTAAFSAVKTIALENPSAATTVNSESSTEADSMKSDARGAYAAALAWHYTGDESYAQTAIAILNAWSIFDGFSAGSDQDKLQAGWIGSLFGPAADLMLPYEGWAPADVDAVRAMFTRAFYPELNTASRWNGNVDLTQINAMLAIAVFNEDQEEFDAGVARLAVRMPLYFYLAEDGENTSPSWNHNDSSHPNNTVTSWVSGVTQETCRDNGHHAQYALAAGLAAAEIAWHQGVDVYDAHEARFTSALELLAQQLNTGDMRGVCSIEAATRSRFDTFEIGYNHYHSRQGFDLPETAQVIAQEIRPSGASDWNIFYETLTHGGLPSALAD